MKLIRKEDPPNRNELTEKFVGNEIFPDLNKYFWREILNHHTPIWNGITYQISVWFEKVVEKSLVRN